MSASDAAEQALRTARRSQRISMGATGVDPRKFTLNRHAAREIRDAQVAASMAEWLSKETGQSIRGESAQEFLDDLEDGVVLCKLAARFGQVTRFRDPPKNEFQRLENFELFAKSVQRLGLSSAPPPSRRGFPLSAVLPCLLEMAVLAQKHAAMLDMDSSVPEDVIEHAEQEKEEQEHAAAEAGATKPMEAAVQEEMPTAKRGNDVVIVTSLDDSEEEEEGVKNAAEDVGNLNHMLGQLHIERMKRQRAGPPKLRIIDVGGKQLVAIERPGEAIGSIVWQGAIDLVHYLHREVGPAVFSNENKGTIIELGAGCGVCGVWAACMGGDVVVTDMAPAIDLLWANVAANAQQIVKSGGSCSARALDFSDGPATEKLVRSLSTDAPLTIVGADVVYGESAKPLLGALQRIFAVRPDTKMYLAYKVRDAMQEEHFFQSVEFSEVGAGAQLPSGDKPSKIFLITGVKNA